MSDALCRFDVTNAVVVGGLVGRVKSVRQEQTPGACEYLVEPAGTGPSSCSNVRWYPEAQLSLATDVEIQRARRGD